MVARDPNPAAVPEDALSPAAKWWRDWRRWLSRLVRLRPGRRSHPVHAARLAIAYLRSPEDALATAGPADRRSLVTSGAVALAVGSIASLVLAALLGHGWVPSLLYVVWLIGWALARLAVLRLAASSTLPRARRAIESAWGPALLPYLLAIIAPLDLLALAASVALTYRGLIAVGLAPREATRCVAWAFGGQIAVELASWIARSWFFVLAR